MASASAELHAAVFQALSEDADLQGILGTGKVYDRVPERAGFPYVVLGAQTVRDWSTATEGGSAIEFFVHIWTDKKGRFVLAETQDRIRRILENIPSHLPNHWLVNLRFQWCEFSRHRGLRHRQGALKFRGVTEPKSDT